MGTNDNHGPTCNLPCPTNCKKSSGKASCAKDTGFCKQCDGRKWHGDKCEVPCSDGCVGGTCDKNSGTCDSGCKEGWWGALLGCALGAEHRLRDLHACERKK